MRMSGIDKLIGHLHTVCKHKYYVLRECWKCGQFKRGLLHDLSKFSPTEFITSVKYYQGYRSPSDAEKEVKGYSTIEQHHIRHNPHHWEYWVVWDPSEQRTIKIPYEYVVEMLCDWIAAGKVYLGDKWTVFTAKEYYEKNRYRRMFHPDTERLILYGLNTMIYYGMDVFYIVMRSDHTKNVYRDGTL